MKNFYITPLVAAMALASATTARAQTETKTAIQEEVIVKGFRSSIELALDKKREATGQVDAIIAEDIADFPDLNLAESLQRIPGIAITRDNGEGQRITVRGLSGQYTRVRINGMEARVGTGDSNERDFDFNMFASELFNSIAVRKTASADVDEGSIGATVDLNSGRALDYADGTTVLLGGNLQYNDLSSDTSPRLTALYAYHDPSDTWGVSTSLAYSKTNTMTSSANTVRWQRSGFRSVNGVTCSGSTDPGCLEVADNFHARIPRYAESDFERERLGLTLGAQFQPSDGTLISFDAMYATFDQLQDFRTLEVLFRGNENLMDVTNYSIVEFPDRIDMTRDISNPPDGIKDPVNIGNGTITAMSVDNAWVRAERYQQIQESEFAQFTLAVEHEISDSLSVSGLLGHADSQGKEPHETTLMYDNRTYNGFRYDYSGSTSKPILAYNGANVNDGTTFQLTDLRDAPTNTETSNDTFKIDLKWTFSDELVISGGINAKKFTLDTESWDRNGNTCDFGYVDCTDPAVYGIRGTAALSESFHFKGATGPGSTKNWVVPNLKGWLAETNYYDEPLDDKDSRREVEEKNAGVYVQLAGELETGKMRFLYDAGVRYVETDQTSSGYNTGVYTTVKRPTYSHTLPAINTALWVTEELVLRASWAETIARPSLGNLSPGGTVGAFNTPATVSFKNPFLDPTEATNFDVSAEWYFADDALLSLAIFSKDVKSFPINTVVYGTSFASTGLSPSLIESTSPPGKGPDPEGLLPPSDPNYWCGTPYKCWDVSTIGNGEGAKIDGYELSLQAPLESLFSDLPPILRNMGFLANYTNVESDVERTSPLDPEVKIKEKLNGLSNSSYNLTVYYEGDKFSTRISMANRSTYLNSNSVNGNGNFYQFVEPATYWDYSASYQATDELTLSLEIVNLMDTPYEVTVDDVANRVLQYDLTGRNIMLGARYSF